MIEKEGEKLRSLIHRTSIRGLIIIFVLSVWDSTALVYVTRNKNIQT